MKCLLWLFVAFAVVSCTNDNSDPIVQDPVIEDVFSIQVDSLNTDLIASPDGNSLYITYSADNGYNENLMRYDLQSGDQTTIVHEDYTVARKLAIVGDQLFSVGTNIWKANLDLSDMQPSEAYLGFGQNGIATFGNTIFCPTGFGNISTFNANTGIPDFAITDRNAASFGSGVCEMDGKIFSFGGFVWENAFVPSDAISIYDINSGNWSQANLPFTSTEVVARNFGDRIVLAGNKFSDFTGAFIGFYDVENQTYEDVGVPLELSSVSIRSIAVVDSEIYVAYIENTDLQLPLMTLKVVKFALP